MTEERFFEVTIIRSQIAIVRVTAGQLMNGETWEQAAKIMALDGDDIVESQDDYEVDAVIDITAVRAPASPTLKDAE